MISFKDKINHMIDHGGVNRTRFIDMKDQQYVKGLMKYVDTLSLDGGYKEAERKRVLFDTIDAKIIAFKIESSYKDLVLTHQNILGSLLSLNIERDTIGDILPKQGIFFVVEELRSEILYSFHSIGNVPIKIIEVDLSSISHEKEYEYFKTTVSSKRLDNIVAKIMKKSRSESTVHIQKEFVKVNHEVCLKPTKMIQNNDILSIRYYGRFEILDGNQLSKKGKYIINYRKFV